MSESSIMVALNLINFTNSSLLHKHYCEATNSTFDFQLSDGSLNGLLLLQLILTVLAMGLSIFNIQVFISTLANKSFHSFLNILVSVLALSDILVANISMPVLLATNASTMGNWSRFAYIIIISSTIISTLLLAGISLLLIIFNFKPCLDLYLSYAILYSAAVFTFGFLIGVLGTSSKELLSCGKVMLVLVNPTSMTLCFAALTALLIIAAILLWSTKVMQIPVAKKHNPFSSYNDTVTIISSKSALRIIINLCVPYLIICFYSSSIYNNGLIMNDMLEAIFKLLLMCLALMRSLNPLIYLIQSSNYRRELLKYTKHTFSCQSQTIIQANNASKSTKGKALVQRKRVLKEDDAITNILEPSPQGTSTGNYSLDNMPGPSKKFGLSPLTANSNCDSESEPHMAWSFEKSSSSENVTARN